MNHPQIYKANSALVTKIRLQVISAYIADTNINANSKLTLKEYTELIVRSNPSLIKPILNALDTLEFNFIRVKFPDEVLEHLRDYGRLTEVLARYSFEVYQNRKGKREDPIITPNKFFLICEQGFSFGGNRFVYIFLTYYMLVNPNATLCIYNLPRKLSTFHDLPHLIASKFANISCLDVDTHRFSQDELLILYKDIGINHIHKTCLPQLKNMLGIESSKEAALSTTRFPDDSDFTLLEHFSRIVNKRLFLLSDQYIKKELPRILAVEKRPIALVCNRDSAYVGPNQPWRDSDIDNYRLAIQYLISEGYFVVRYNSSGHPSSISNPYFVDLAQTESCDQLLQLHLAANCSVIIGANSGVTGFAQSCSSAPTLYIDSPTLHAHSPWLKLISSPKRVFISDDTLFNPSKTQELLLSSMWDYQKLEKNGLRLQPHDEYSILEDVKYFLAIKRGNSWSKVPSLSQINGNSTMLFNTLLTPSAQKNLYPLFAYK